MVVSDKFWSQNTNLKIGASLWDMADKKLCLNKTEIQQHTKKLSAFLKKWFAFLEYLSVCDGLEYANSRLGGSSCE